MRWSERLSIQFKILLPLIFLLLSGAFPASRAVLDAERALRDAQQTGNHQAAAEAMRQVWEHEPWRANLLEPIGRESLAAGNLNQAAHYLEEAEKAQALSPDGQFLLGDAYLQRGDGVLAESAWKALLRDGAAPNVLKGRAYERLVQAQRERGNFSAAIQTLRDWRAADPQNPRAAFLLGLFLSIEKPEEALPLLVESARQDSTYSPTVQELRGGLALASSAKQPGDGWFEVGRSLGSAGQWDLAEQAFLKATQTAPENAEAWAFLGEARYQLGKSGKADLDRANALDPDSTAVRALTAMHLASQREFDQALKILEAIAKKEPKEPIWQAEIGYTQAKKGDMQAALAAYQKSVEISPENALYWRQLALFSISYNVDIKGVGLPAARQAVLLSPNDAASLDAMGWALLKLEDGATAERFLQRALDRDATYAPAYLHMGQLYLNRQDTQKAHPYLVRAASLAANDLTGEYARRLLLQYYGEGG